VKGDVIILANGMGVKNFEETKSFHLKAVRGQVTYIKANEKSKNIKCNLCYGGYMAPALNGGHLLGSTFQRWLDHSQIIPEDDADNLKKLAEAVPGLGAFEITGNRAAVRTTTDEHFPIFGPVQGSPGLYVSTAHGSHGIVTSIAAARAIADDILKRA
jgi:tRNA 5-methylaminomethyl-2-thiouridine biosynthesis bifunctional protein